MRQNRSLFRHFLKGHLLFIFLPPAALIVFSAIAVFSVDGEEQSGFNPHLILFWFGFIMIAFVTLSWMFFLRLRKRLTGLQKAMITSAGHNVLPEPVPVQTDRMDEIDQLGSSFNRMIQQLEDSRRRAAEEERLRHRLIAHLSHDLRTPLTILRGHITRLDREPLSTDGQQSLAEMNRTITRAGDLMEDLVSYTLLTSGKYPFEPVSTDMLRLVRSSVAAWYPVFEEHGIEVEVDLPEEDTFYWVTDPKWMARVLDNLFQNIIRHAASGKYARITVDADNEHICVADRGPGMGNTSREEGAGIGLSAAVYMLNHMKLQADYTSTENGTQVMIKRA